MFKQAGGIWPPNTQNYAYNINVILDETATICRSRKYALNFYSNREKTGNAKGKFSTRQWLSQYKTCHKKEHFAESMEVSVSS